MGAFWNGFAIGYFNQRLNNIDEALQNQGEVEYVEGTFYNAKQFNYVASLGQTYLDYGYPFIFADIFTNLRAISKSVPAYFSGILMKVIFPLMVVSHAGLIAMLWQAVAENPNFLGAGGGSQFMCVAFSVMSVVLVLTAISPLLTTWEHRGVWKIVGGKPRLTERIAIFAALAPVALLAAVLIPSAEPIGKLVVGVGTLLFAVLPLIVRYVGARNIREGIHLWEYLAERHYVQETLKRKVIGTPGASLGTSGFGSAQVSAGVEGERKTSVIIDKFVHGTDNAVVFHSVRWNMQGAPYDIDHVVVVGGNVVFLDSKKWSKADYTMLESGDTMLRDGLIVDNSDIHIQSGAETYINQFGIQKHSTLVVVWTDGTVSNRGYTGPRLIKGNDLSDWLNQAVLDAQGSEPDASLLRMLEANTAG